MKAVITLILLCVFASTAAAVEWSEYLLNRNADNAFSKGDFQQAYDQSAELIRENSDNGRYFHNLAESAMHLQRYDEAVDYYSQAVQLMDDKKQSVHSMNGLGAAYLMDQKPNEAVAVLKKVLTDDPKNAIAKHNLEVALQALQEQQQREEQDYDEETSGQSQELEAEQQPEQEESDDEVPPEPEEKSPEEERQEALDEEQQRKEEKEETAQEILERLLQNEEESRRKHLKRPPSELGVENDW